MTEEVKVETDEPRIIDDPTDIWEENKGLIIAAIVGIVVVVGGISYWYTSKQAAISTANSLYAAAEDEEAWSAIAEQYPDTQAAAQSLIRLAHLALEVQDYGKAETLYKDFLSRFPENLSASVVEFAHAEALQAQGKTEEAIAAYQKLTETSSHPFGAGASLALAKIYKNQGDIDQARNAITTALEQNPGAFQQELQRLMIDLPTPPKSEEEVPTSETPVEGSEEAAPAE